MTPAWADRSEGLIEINEGVYLHTFHNSGTFMTPGIVQNTEPIGGKLCPLRDHATEVFSLHTKTFSKMWDMLLSNKKHDPSCFEF